MAALCSLLRKLRTTPCWLAHMRDRRQPARQPKRTLAQPPARRSPHHHAPLAGCLEACFPARCHTDSVSRLPSIFTRMLYVAHVYCRNHSSAQHSGQGGRRVDRLVLMVFIGRGQAPANIVTLVDAPVRTHRRRARERTLILACKNARTEDVVHLIFVLLNVTLVDVHGCVSFRVRLLVRLCAFAATSKAAPQQQRNVDVLCVDGDFSCYWRRRHLQ